jgi:hypothetical protein
MSNFEPQKLGSDFEIHHSTFCGSKTAKIFIASATYFIFYRLRSGSFEKLTPPEDAYCRISLLFSGSPLIMHEKLFFGIGSLSLSESLSVSAFAQSVTADTDSDSDSDSERIDSLSIFGAGETNFGLFKYDFRSLSFRETVVLHVRIAQHQRIVTRICLRYSHSFLDRG